MLKRDYLVKQFEEFGKVMAVLLGLKRDGKFSELEELIRNTALKYTATEIAYAESLPDEQLLDILTNEKKLSDEQLRMLGDLLYEQGCSHAQCGREMEAGNAFRKTMLIYTFLQNNATMPYSLDMHYKLNVLKSMFT